MHNLLSNALVLLCWLLICWSPSAHAFQFFTKVPEMVKLPPPRSKGHLSIESALSLRRSVRSYSKQPLSLNELSQLLWAAQGINSRDTRRTAPSAGALYPLELYLVAGLTTDISPGVYRYSSEQHALNLIKESDLRPALSGAALNQECIAAAPACFVITGVYRRTAKKYGKRARRYVHLEAGHASENILLQAVALKLGTVVVGAFDDQEVQRVLDLPTEHEPLLVIPVGFPRDRAGEQ
jgi:SagB-type dehydrogenase family enzyme